MLDILKVAKPIELSYSKHVPSTGVEDKKVPVLVYHGIFSSKKSWDKIGKEIADKTKRIVFCLDIRDHGKSPWSNEDNGCFSWQGIVLDLANFLKKNNIEKAVLIGHSLGGLNLSRFVTLFPDLTDALILVDIQPKVRLNCEAVKNVKLFADFLRNAVQILNDEKLDLAGGKKRLIELINSQIQDGESYNDYEESLVMKDGQLSWRFHFEGIYNFLSEMNEVSDIIPAYEGDVLLVHGSESPFFSKNDYDYVKSFMPNTEFHCIEKAGHNLNLSHADEFVAKVVAFINKTI